MLYIKAMQGFILGIIVLFFAHTSLAQNIAVIVNNEPISDYDIDSRVRVGIISAGLPDTPRTRQKFRTQTLKTIIDETLQQQEIERLKLTPPKGAVEEAFENIAKRNGTTLPQLAQKLSNKGLSLEPLRQQVATSLTWGAAVQKKYGQNALVSEQDIMTLKTQLKQNQGQPEVRFKELYISDFGAQRGQADKVIQDIYRRLKGGASFDALAQQFSESPNRDGSGWILANTLEPNTYQTLKNLNKNSLSKPVRVKGGYAIFLLQAKRLIQAEKQPEQVVELYQTIVENDAEKAKTLSQTIKGCKMAASTAKEHGLKSSGSLGKLNISDLPPQLSNAVAQLSVNQSTKPLAMSKTAADQPQTFGILTVCSKQQTQGSIAKLPNDRVLESRLRTQKLQRLSTEYLDELRRKAYIEYRNG